MTQKVVIRYFDLYSQDKESVVFIDLNRLDYLTIKDYSDKIVLTYQHYGEVKKELNFPISYLDFVKAKYNEVLELIKNNSEYFFIDGKN